MDSYSTTGYLKDDFRLFHITDEEENSFSYHYHDFYKILIFIRGDVTYHIEGKSFDLKPYDIVLVNAGEIHKPVINSRSAYERVILYISPEFMDSCRDKADSLNQCFVQAQASRSNVLRIELFSQSRLYQVLQELEKSFEGGAFAAALYQKALFMEFLILLNRFSMDSYSGTYIENSRCNSKILPVLDYIAEHLAEDISIDQLASCFYMSRYYLMHLFKQETGYSVASYISTKRLLRARALIQNGMSVTDACYQCGFKNYSSFSRAYKKLFHTSARGERNQS